MNRTESEARDQRLLRLLADGFSVARIAETFGITTQAVYLRLKKLGISESRARTRAERNARIVRLRREGWTLERIAVDAGITMQAVALVLKGAQAPVEGAPSSSSSTV